MCEWARKNPEKKAESNLRYRRKNAAEINENRRLYTEKNREKINADARKWRSENVAKLKEARRLTAAENREKILAQRKAWRIRNPEKLREDSSRRVAALGDSYVRQKIEQTLGIKSVEIPSAMIAVKRKHLQILRKLKEKPNER